MPRPSLFLALPAALALALLPGCVRDGAPASQPSSPTAGDSAMPDDPATTATFGAGCFWCTEAVLEQLDGVLDVRSGYMGGAVANPTYEDVCGGETGHAEVVQVHFDPKVISYDTLLDWFWKLHDPTTLNRQGNDVGTQYRSVIFVHSDEQRRAAEASRTRAQAAFNRPIVTEIAAAGPFYEAEGYHQDYYRGNKRQPYCQVLIAPKLDKLGLER
jgi:peptide-methionine (S)-S-oxide reductase